MTPARLAGLAKKSREYIVQVESGRRPANPPLMGEYFRHTGASRARSLALLEAWFLERGGWLPED